jgi:hypothetical protein
MGAEEGQRPHRRVYGVAHRRTLVSVGQERTMQNCLITEIQPASWVGSCGVAGEPDQNWRECRIVAVSRLGVVVTLDHKPSELRPGRLMFLDFSADGGAVNVRLEGEIRSVTTPTVNRDIRVRVEFIRISEKDQMVNAVLDVMSEALAA